MWHVEDKNEKKTNMKKNKNEDKDKAWWVHCQLCVYLLQIAMYAMIELKSTPWFVRMYMCMYN